MTHHPVQPRTRNLAREQRRTPTRAEEMLWRDLRGRRCDGHKFRRQVPLGAYVVDFLCLEARLIVELDGAPHSTPEQIAHDARRDRLLKSQGFRVLRFPNDVILGGSGEPVLQDIRKALRVAPSSDPR